MALAFVLTAFFVDVSRSLNAHGASLEVAAQAARAAADQVTQESLRTGDPTALRIDPAAAESAGQAWLAEAGATGTVRVLDGGTAVRVSARVPCTATLLAAFGYRDLSKPATAEATLLYGTAGSDGQPITYRADLSVRTGWSIFGSSSSEVLPKRTEKVIAAAAMAASVLDRRQGGVR